MDDAEAIHDLFELHLQFHGHHSYFRIDFHMQLAVNIGHIQPPHCTLGDI